MEKKIEAIDKIIKRMVEISDSRLCKQLNANWVMLRNSLLTQPADVQERAKDRIETWYKQWCKETGRSGGVLIGSSIRELLQSFAEQKYPYDNDLYAGDSRVIEAERAAFISAAEPILAGNAGASSLQAENERLREALEKIIQNLSGWEDTDTMMGIAINNARTALNKQ